MGRLTYKGSTALNLRGGFLSFLKGFYRATALLLAVVLFVCISAADVSAEITGDEAFNNMQWDIVFEDNIQSAHGVIQSICCTDYYIITIENTTEDPNQPDTVSAYYKLDHDEYGNDVEQYSLAKRVNDFDWEHGNGMTYNPRTNEIYVAPYTALRPENAGCIFVMDPNTLSYKNTIKIADGYNILGIEYLEDSDEYMIITNDSGGYSIKRLDANFQIIDDFGPTSTSPGVNYQDFCVDGDYLLISPLTFGMGIGEYVNIFSISRRGIIQSAFFNPGDQGAQHYEPESICEPEPGVFLMPVTATGYDGSMYVYFYRTVLPYYFTVDVTSQTVDTATLSDSVNEKLPYNADTMKTELTAKARAGGNVKTDAAAGTDESQKAAVATDTNGNKKTADAAGADGNTKTAATAANDGNKKTAAATANDGNVKSAAAGTSTNENAASKGSIGNDRLNKNALTASDDKYNVSALAAVMEDTGGSVTEGSAKVLRGTGYAVNYTPKEGYETSSVFVDGEEIDLEEYPDRYVIENIQENHTVDVTFAVKPTPIPTPTPTEKPQEITKPSQAEGAGIDESSNSTPGENADSSETDSKKGESSGKSSGGFLAGLGSIFSAIGGLVKGALSAVGGFFKGIGSLIMRGLRAIGSFFAGIPKLFSKPVTKGGKTVGSVVFKVLLAVLALLFVALGISVVHVQQVRKKKAEELKRKRERVRRQLEAEIEAIDLDSIPVPQPTWQKPDAKKTDSRMTETGKQRRKKQEIGKQETRKQETRKQETGKKETRKQETRKQETGKKETRKQETRKQETGKKNKNPEQK